MSFFHHQSPAGSAAILTLLFVTTAVSAQITLSNPSFPKEEAITYIRTTEHGSEMVNVKMLLIEPQSDSTGNKDKMQQSGPASTRPYYHYHMQSDSKDMLVNLHAENLEVFYSEVRLKNTYSTIRRINEVLTHSKSAGPGELLVCDGNGLDISLRGFPWHTHQKAEIVFLNGSDKFKLELKVDGRETLRVNNTPYECHKVQMGLSGFIGSFFPKSYFWYAVDEPHVLVRAEVAGMMGEDANTIEMVSYSASH